MKKMSLGLLAVGLALLLSASIASAQQGPSAAAGPELSVSITPSKKTVSPNGKFTWTVSVKNTGNATARSVRVESELPENVRLNNIISSQGGPCKVKFPKVICSPGTLAPGKGETSTFYIQAPGSSDILRDKVKATSPNTPASVSSRAVSLVKVN